MSKLASIVSASLPVAEEITNGGICDGSFKHSSFVLPNRNGCISASTKSWRSLVLSEIVSSGSTVSPLLTIGKTFVTGHNRARVSMSVALCPSKFTVSQEHQDACG